MRYKRREEEEGEAFYAGKKEWRKRGKQKEEQEEEEEAGRGGGREGSRKRRRSHHQHHAMEERRERGGEEVKAGDVSASSLRADRYRPVVSAHQRDVGVNPAEDRLLVRKPVVTTETGPTCRTLKVVMKSSQ